MAPALVWRHLRGEPLVDALLAGLFNRLNESRSGLAVALLFNQNQDEVPPRFDEGWIKLHRLADEQFAIVELVLFGKRRSVVVQEGRIRGASPPRAIERS